MINLETWIPSTYDLTEDLVPMCFLEGGALRKPGYFGWFVPKELLKPLEKYHYKRSNEDISYSEFRNRTFASFFDIADATLRSYLQNYTIKTQDET